MRIGIQARELAGGGGTHTYVRSILPHLIRAKPAEFVLCYSGELCSELAETGVDRVDPMSNAPLLSDHLLLPYLFRKQDIDVAWFPKNVVPLFYDGISVVTVHDLGHFVEKDFYSFLDRTYMKRMIRLSCARADRVIAVSENTKADIVRYTRAAPEKIDVVYHGIDDRFWRSPTAAERSRFRAKYGLGDTLLYGGNVATRKNVCRLIDAFERTAYRQELGAELVLTGGPPTNPQSRKIQSNSAVTYLGRIEHDEVPLLYHVSDLLVYLSLYEGFGLPILEAMASRTPVIASRRASLPEIVGDAGVLVDPENGDRIAKEIDALMMDDGSREALVEKGIRRARRFTWERSAKQTMDAIESAIQDST